MIIDMVAIIVIASDRGRSRSIIITSDSNNNLKHQFQKSEKVAK